MVFRIELKTRSVPMRSITTVVEDETAVFELGVEEDDAPVKWFKDGKEIIPDGKRIQIVSEGKKRKLIIKNCKIEDAGMITAKTTGDERSAPLGVAREYLIFKT